MAAAKAASPEAAKARRELKERYELRGFVSPLHALDGAELATTLAAFQRFESVHRRRICEWDSSREMNHAWMPWLRDLARHSGIVSAVREAFGRSDICLYATELLTIQPGQFPAPYSDWQTDAPAFNLMLKPVDRRHFVTAFLALTACDRRHGCLHVRPTAVGGRASDVDVPLELRPGEFSLHGPSTKHCLCSNNSAQALCLVVLRYIRASTVDLHGEEHGKEDVLLVSGTDEQGHFEEMPEFPAEGTQDGLDLRELMMEQRRDKALAGEVLKGREGLKRPLIDPSSYTVTELLMCGTFKSIHVAKWGAGKHCVVVKRVLNRKLLREVRKHFHEARILEKLSHPCILQLVGLVDGPDQLDMLLEYCPEGAMPGRLTHQARGTSVQLLCDLICALVYMHQEGFAHLDVKPNNVLVSSGRGKLCDFETTMHLPKSRRLFLCGIGTLGYRAPEVDRELECDATKADVWSLGRVGEFAEDSVRGIWSGMGSLTAANPELRPSTQMVLGMYRKLHGSCLLIT
uniref:Protein kinase domain-containing protein n=1 Tax=Alexandrium monilatum TaxID=311494 RepID=A0A7S4UZR5_9DINO